jgi:hypothetical protein
MRGSLVLALAGVCALSASAVAQLGIDSMLIQERVFNDYPNSTLKIGNDYPSSVVFHEEAFGEGGFANRHRGRFSGDGGATEFVFDIAKAWDISADMTLDGAAVGEAGFLMGPDGNDAQFIAKPNGEIAAFGGFFPFFSNNVNAPQIPQYVMGTTINMRMIYSGGDEPTIEFLVDGISTGAMLVDVNGFNGPVEGGVYVQNTPFGQQDVHSTATFGNFVTVPTPASAALLGVAGLTVFGGRRRR